MAITKQEIVSKLGAVGKPLHTGELLRVLGYPETMDNISAISNVCLDGSDDVVYVNNYGWKLKSMCGFVAHFKGKQIDVWATSQWDAKKKAFDMFKMHKRFENLLSVHLAIKADGSQHTISTASL